MADWQYYPKSNKITDTLKEVIRIFNEKEEMINSKKNNHNSDKVLSLLEKDLKKLGFKVESGKKKENKISIPVLFGKNGKPEKSFEVDAFKEEEGIMIEIEAGRAMSNYQFLKDFFKGIVIEGVHYLIIALRNEYRGNKDFNVALNWFDTLYASKRINIPFKGILIIGY